MGDKETTIIAPVTNLTVFKIDKELRKFQKQLLEVDLRLKTLDIEKNALEFERLRILRDIKYIEDKIIVEIIKA